MSSRSKETDPLIKTTAWSVAIGLIALGGLALASFVFKWEGFWRGAGQPFATALAALAAISAAAIALHNGRSQLEEVRKQRDQDQARYEEQRTQDQARYEEQRDRDNARYEEQREQDQARWSDQRRREDMKELRSRFSEATEQLAHEVPAIRRSGAYAMASLVQDWRNLGVPAEAKVCLQVLGAYVVSPNPTYSIDDSGRTADAGPDGPIRALIVSLVCATHPLEFDSWAGACSVFNYGDLRAVDLVGELDNIVSFSGADLTNASFIHADIPDGMEFGHSEMDRVWLLSANLRNANFRWASLKGAHFDRSELAGADFKYAELEGASFEGATYSRTTKWPEGFTPPDGAVLDDSSEA